MILNQESPDGKTLRSSYDSVEELASCAEGYLTERWPNGAREKLDYADFYGEDCDTPQDALTMARTGWDRYLDETLDLARDAIKTMEATTEVVSFQPVWDVSGATVDIGEYLSGVPECMIELPPVPTTKTGRVVTVCASIGASSALSAGVLTRRGMIITALALELQRLGISTELYADSSAAPMSTPAGIEATSKQHMRILVKGPNDVLDPAKVLFAYAHPAMLRVLTLTARHGLPPRWQEMISVGSFYGQPADGERNLPDGTIYIPSLRSSRDLPDAPEALRRYLTGLGLVKEAS